MRSQPRQRVKGSENGVNFIDFGQKSKGAFLYTFCSSELRGKGSLSVCASEEKAHCRPVLVDTVGLFGAKRMFHGQIESSNQISFFQKTNQKEPCIRDRNH